MKTTVTDRKKPVKAAKNKPGSAANKAAKKTNARKAKAPVVGPELIDRVMEGFDASAKDIVLPVLRRAQDVFGYIPEEAVLELAKRLKIPPAHLYGVATFYDQFLLKLPGRNIVRLCTNVACNIQGAESLMDYIGGKLGIKRGGTTRDGRFTLLEVECIGACGSGPAMMVNDDFHYELTEKKIDGILSRYR